MQKENWGGGRRGIRPSPLGRVPPKGAGEVRYHVSFCCYFAANSYCGNLFRLFHLSSFDEKSTFPKGEGFFLFTERGRNHHWFILLPKFVSLIQIIFFQLFPAKRSIHNFHILLWKNPLKISLDFGFSRKFHNFSLSIAQNYQICGQLGCFNVNHYKMFPKIEFLG